MAEVQLKRKITLRRKEKPAEFTFDGLLKVKLLWQSKTDLDLCIFFKRKMDKSEAYSLQHSVRKNLI